MTDYRVTCITPDRSDPDYRIDEIGFANEVYQIDAVIQWLRDAGGKHRLWVVDNAGNSVWVQIRTHPASGLSYLATEADGLPLNNLSSLPRRRRK